MNMRFQNTSNFVEIIRISPRKMIKNTINNVEFLSYSLHNQHMTFINLLTKDSQ